ncbi:uncharacterized protein LOC122647792 isoform X2 [Telopea speciosissima]|uniref:uncharacterized protein LOC122647792 isoform X2 n=1 Tax=Telopea speciosissima TaxID=54955 RepID=UPI001CC6359B|nr:uncharacterized protein LOC122647792 isoform X2 [Telopea speciosissima]
MNTGRQTVRDLIEEAKKRTLLLVICVIGLSYLMSLTSSSVWVNMPAAASLIVLLGYISIDIEMRRKATAHSDKLSSADHFFQKKPPEVPKVSLQKSNWRRKVNSPVVEAAIDQFTRHLVSEWVTDLWYSRLTPDRDGPEELVQIINGVLGEVSCRVRDINLIDLLIRDVINLICTHLKLFRASQAKIVRQQLEEQTIDHRDLELKQVLAAENKLHPALFSAEAEHKVLQYLMDGLVSFSFKPEDLQCSFFRYIARELLACSVMRPVLNLASPRFINERIESLVLSIKNKADKGVTTSAQDASQSKPNGASKTSSDHFSRFQDRSVTGVELVQLKREHSITASGDSVKEKMNGTSHSKDPLLSIDTQSSHSLSSLPSDFLSNDRKDIQWHKSGGERGEMLDVMPCRKIQTPEHFENMWTEVQNYKKKEGANQLAKHMTENFPAGIPGTVDHSKLTSKHQLKDGTTKFDISQRNTSLSPHARTDGTTAIHPRTTVHQDEHEHEHDQMLLEEVESESSSSYTEEDESGMVTGLDSPETKVWDSKNNRNAAGSFRHHPLENSGRHMTRKGRRHYPRLSKIQSGRKRYRLSNQKVNTWQEVERTTFRSGDGQDILNSSKEDAKAEDSSDDALENWGRVHSGVAAPSSAASISITKDFNSSSNSLEKSLLTDSFLKLRCEVLGANIVKSDSKTFAVYSISVTDANNNSWSIKRRFRHFEELHRRLKEFPQYNLNLPPKHFLSTGLEIFVVQERCKLLDKYLKRLLQLPTISGSIEVWDFLSVDSQMYMFSNSLSIIETLSVNLDNKSDEKSTKVQNLVGVANDPSLYRGEHLNTNRKETALQIKRNLVADNPGLRRRSISCLPVKIPGKEHEHPMKDSGSDSDDRLQRSDRYVRKPEMALKERGSDNPQGPSEVLLDAATYPTLPTEWIPPNLSVPILDLVDVIFQLHEGGWIRRQALWVVKQVLQLGMGDAFDDWLIEKIQLLRRGSVIASVIKRVEQLLWPDGIFITKHPKHRRPPPPSVTQSQGAHHDSQPTQISSSKKEGVLTDEQKQQEAARRAKFVYELMIDKAPAALVGLVGRKEYEQCAKDLYFFLQSTVCLKQLAFDLLELLLLSTFPELDGAIKQLHEDKQKFGQLNMN